MKFAGLDIETTGTDPNLHHRLIQIGIALASGPRIASDVQPIGDMKIDASALAINKFTLGRIGAAPLQTDVDTNLDLQLSVAGCKHGELTPIGWNVGGFDMVFVKRELPKTAAFFNYRVLDLTGLAIIHEIRTGKVAQGLKDAFAILIAGRLGRDQPHDALYDAEAALEAMQLFYAMEEL